MDETIKNLIRFVARGFYNTTQILIVDAIIIHSVLSEDDLIYLLSIKRKELRALAHTLVTDRIISTHVQKEDSQQRLTTRTYFYLHITEAIDAIKWKVHSIVNNLKLEMSTLSNPQGYICPRCGKKINQLDAISLLSIDRTEFICDTCDGVLIEDDSSIQASLRQGKLEKLMFQLDPIISYLKKIDESVVQDNNFEMALVKSIPAQANLEDLYSLKMPTKKTTSPQESQATLHVSITANDQNLEKEQQEKELRRLKLEQNALPSWHSASTVGTTNEIEEEKEENVIDVKPEIVETKEKEGQDALAAYYAQLAEMEAQEAEKAQADDDEDEDDDDEFDDIL